MRTPTGVSADTRRVCGIFGILTPRGERPALAPDEVVRRRDLLAHRGPDRTGLWDGGNAVLAHRRLAVIDPTPEAGQPFVAADGRSALVYNGELYNDADLRRDLAARGVTFRTRCDAETLLAALAVWGQGSLPRLRGMFAFAWYDAAAHRMLLARDPLGIKPLYWCSWVEGGVPRVAIASEMPPLLGLAGPARPDMVTASAYLTTIRTTLGERTLYQGIRTLQPGEALWVEAAGPGLRFTPVSTTRTAAVTSPHDVTQRVREAVSESVRLHMRADVPTCALLSGGLDSTIIAAIAREHTGELRTYCSGARSDAGDDDFAHARLAAAALGLVHTEAPVTREMFAERWPAMVAAMGVPLSTPNEVAINEVARRLRAGGDVVALSGEGADELFGGYDAPLAAAARHIDAGNAEPGVFTLTDAAWMPLDAKAVILNERVWRGVEQDATLIDHYRTTYDDLAAERDDDTPLQVHLRFARRINLAGLLGRLDTATMLAGVEGRTPFADSFVAGLAESLPMTQKYDAAATPSTKRALRTAFAHAVPASVLNRPKASFPLPFAEWLEDTAGVLRASAFANEVFTPAAIETVAARPREYWRLAWPMVNLALWARRLS